MNSRPNIVLLVADDHGREALGCYGNPVIRTPGMDRLAREGVRFTNSFCTTASCAASRATILTGLQNHTTGTYGHTHGSHHFSCFDDVRTLPALLQEGGYRTGRVGKRHFAPTRLFPFHWEKPEGLFGRDDVRMSEACREFVKIPGPFFLYWCSHNPHRGGPVPNHPLGIDGFGNPAADFPGDAEERYNPASVMVPPFLNDTPETRAEIAQYYQSIARLDRGLVRLLQVLEQEGQLANTVILYLSDNGAAFPQAKTTLYDPGMQLPCLVRAPGQQRRGGTCDALVTWADITPTVLDLAGVPFDPAAFHGRSFVPVLEQESPSSWRDEIYAAHTFHEITNYYPMRVVRTKRHKFIYNIAWKLDYPSSSDIWKSATWQREQRDRPARLGARTMDAFVHRPRFELYDLQADPNELDNLAENPAQAALVQTFIAKLQAFQKATRDPWLHKWTYE
jgi:N-sulfoglucosamine sulfohydrolase